MPDPIPALVIVVGVTFISMATGIGAAVLFLVLQ